MLQDDGLRKSSLKVLLKYFREWSKSSLRVVSPGNTTVWPRYYEMARPGLKMVLHLPVHRVAYVASWPEKWFDLATLV